MKDSYPGKNPNANVATVIHFRIVSSYCPSFIFPTSDKNFQSCRGGEICGTILMMNLNYSPHHPALLLLWYSYIPRSTYSPCWRLDPDFFTPENNPLFFSPIPSCFALVVKTKMLRNICVMNMYISFWWDWQYRLSWLTNSAPVYEPKCEGWGGVVAGSQPMSKVQLCTWSPNKKI